MAGHQTVYALLCFRPFPIPSFYPRPKPKRRAVRRAPQKSDGSEPLAALFASRDASAKKDRVRLSHAGSCCSCWCLEEDEPKAAIIIIIPIKDVSVNTQWVLLLKCVIQLANLGHQLWWFCPNKCQAGACFGDLSNPAQRIPKVTECYQQKQLGPSKIIGLIQDNHLQEANEIWGLCKLFCEIHSGNEGILGLLGGRSSHGWLITLVSKSVGSVVSYL